MAKLGNSLQKFARAQDRGGWAKTIHRRLKAIPGGQLASPDVSPCALTQTAFSQQEKPEQGSSRRHNKINHWRLRLGRLFRPWRAEFD
jgi:hypothetical protein